MIIFICFSLVYYLCIKGIYVLNKIIIIIISSLIGEILKYTVIIIEYLLISKNTLPNLGSTYMYKILYSNFIDRFYRSNEQIISTNGLFDNEIWTYYIID